MTRPRKKLEGQARQNVLRIRLTAEERKLLDRAADAKTLETSTWARSLLISAAKKDLGETKENA